jgi:hypothetical protein
MEGLTKTMYAIVMKVVRPARISVRQPVCNDAKSKYASARRMNEDMNYMTVAQTLACALVLALPLAAADDAQLLARFQETKPDVAEVHVIQEEPLLVAVTGRQLGRKTRADWPRGELLGVFAHRGEKVVQISMQANAEFPTEVWVDRQSSDSITFGLADPADGVLSDNLKIFFDPKNYIPIRILHFAPVHVRTIRLTNGVITLAGNDGKQDFAAQEKNGVWRVTVASGVPQPAARPPLVPSTAPVPQMPVSTIAQFEEARPARAREIPAEAPREVEEKVGPYQRAVKKIWVGKTFYDFKELVGVGDIGYFDETTQNWVFLHIPEMADWSTSALLVEADTVWAGLVQNGEGIQVPGGLLRYNLTTHKATLVPLQDVIDKIISFHGRIYCGTSRGFAIVEQDKVRRFEFVPQLDGAYVVRPVT